MTPRDTDLTARLTGFAPAIRPPMFPTADVAYAATDTWIGRLWLARVADGPVIACVFTALDPEADTERTLAQRLSRSVSPRVLRLPGPLDPVRRQIDDYLDGHRTSFDVPVELTLATPFQRVVLATLRERVGYGTRATYGQLAAWAQRPRSARAVGAALGANPLCLLLPCHRVVGADGSLTGYAGGLPAKQALLHLESGSGSESAAAGSPRG